MGVVYRQCFILRTTVNEMRVPGFYEPAGSFSVSFLDPRQVNDTPTFCFEIRNDFLYV